jgi:hypothetical protein
MGKVPYCGKDAGVEEPASGWGDGGQDGLAGQLMPEGKPVIGSAEQSPVGALVDFVKDRPGNGQQEIRVDNRADHRRDVEDGPRLGRKTSRAGQDRIAGSCRYRLILGSECFGHKERVAPRQPVQGRCIATSAFRQLLHRLC